MKRVLIIEAQIKQYRVAFYEGLAKTLRENSVQLCVAYSEPPPAEALKEDTCDLPAEYGLKVQAYWLLRGKCVLQPLFRSALSADLVIVDQANKFCLNHFLLPLSRVGLKRVAFIGHGRNESADRIWFSEWYRRYTLNWAQRWFAYTMSTTRYLIANGIPASKITTIDNTTDTGAFRKELGTLSRQDKIELRCALGIPSSSPVGIYCGAMDKVKRVPFLIDAVRLVRESIPDFHLLLVGGGPCATSTYASLSGVPWIHCLGPQFGKAKAQLFAIADACLIPGAVGLAIVDAFAAGLPLLTTRLPTHGPEIEYLEEGKNGLMSDPDVISYANTVAGLLSDRETLGRFRAAAARAGSRHTIENMIANVATGICQSLGISAPVLSQSMERAEDLSGLESIGERELLNCSRDLHQ